MDFSRFMVHPYQNFQFPKEPIRNSHLALVEMLQDLLDILWFNHLSHSVL